MSLVVVTPYGETGASSRVRVFDWLRHLNAGAEIHSYLGSGDHSARTLAQRPFAITRAEYELRALSQRVHERTLLLSRLASPFSNGSLEANLLRRAQHSVYDFDDALWASSTTGIRRLFPKGKIWLKSIRSADCVVAGSEYLCDYAARLSTNVVYIPSCIEPRSYVQKRSYELQAAPILVWLGSISTEKHLELIEDALLILHARKGLRLKLIGSKQGNLGALESMIDRVRWTNSDYAMHLASGDVAIAPLLDDEFARGKCAYKLLQYGATGLPIVGSPVGANAKVLDALGGLIVNGTTEWVEAIEQLLDEASSAREARGVHARGQTSSLYSYEVWGSSWAACVLPERRPSIAN